MKASITFSALVIIFVLTAVYAAAQKAPPPMSPAYFPEKWKEFTFEEDRFVIRFPGSPTVTEIPGKRGETTKSYKYSSFVIFEIRVTTFPLNIEENVPVKELLEEMKKMGFAALGEQNPKIVKEEEIAENGKTGKFVHSEHPNGEVLRMKFFVSGERVYYMFAASEKGAKHGVNWENDFEKVTMGFLDSFKFL